MKAVFVHSMLGHSAASVQNPNSLQTRCLHVTPSTPQSLSERHVWLPLASSTQHSLSAGFFFCGGLGVFRSALSFFCDAAL